MADDMTNVIRAFEHLIELLEDEGADIDVIHAVEAAKELLEESLQSAVQPRLSFIYPYEV